LVLWGGREERLWLKEGFLFGSLILLSLKLLGLIPKGWWRDYPVFPIRIIKVKELFKLGF